MGSGHSVQVNEHLQRWEDVLSDLDQMTHANRRILTNDRIYGESMRVGDPEDEASDRGARRSSSLVSFTGNNNNNTVSTNVNGTGTGAGEPVAGVSNGSFNVHTSRMRNLHNCPELRTTESKTCFNFANVLGTAGDGTVRSGGSTSNQPPKHSRQQSLEIKKARMKLFKSYETTEADVLTDSMQRNHFGALAVALSYLLGGHKGCRDRRQRVTVEDIFFAAQVPLHFLHTGPPHLPLMTDIVREFLDVDNRFKDEYSLETLHLDVLPTIGQVDLGMNEVGDRQTRMQLPQFRRVITQDCEEETHVIRIVNYDPYVLEQEMLVDAYEDEDELNSPLAASVLGSSLHRRRRFSPQNEGAYGVIVDVRTAVQLMVTIAESVGNDSLQVKLTEVPAASLFKAMMTAEEGHRARGFIRVFKKDSVPGFTNDEIQLFWTPELCSGKVLGTTLLGTHAFVISHHISPHIVVVAWAMHLLSGVRPGTHGYGSGLPVSDIIRVMKFPADVFLDGVLSLEQVYKYAVEYMIRTNRTYTVNLFPVLTKISREDAVPTISVFDLESILLDVRTSNLDPEAPEHIMVIMYNASVAHNVLYVVHDPQWCVLAGYDQETQTALLIDAHPKTFSRTWSCPLDRLHKAITGSGYMIFSKNATCSSPMKGVGAPRHLTPVVQSRLQLLKQQSVWIDPEPTLQTFSFPKLALMPTIIAMACCRLGIFTTFEDVIHTLPFEISSLLIRLFTLESFNVCLTQYLYFCGLEKEMQVEVWHSDFTADRPPELSVQGFTALVEASLADVKNRVLIVHFDSTCINVNGAANPFGNLGIVIGMDAATGIVTMCDCNPNSYERTWAVSLGILYTAMSDTLANRKHRSRGCLVLSRVIAKLEPKFSPEQSRDFKLELLPVQNVFHVSPSPHFQGMSFAFSQLGCFYSPEEIFYEAYLKTMDDQRRRGSQAFAWRDVDVSLSVIKTEINPTFMAQVCRLFLDSRSAGSHQQKAAGASGNEEDILVEALDDIDVDDGLNQLLKEATQSQKVVLLLNYDIYKAHGIRDMGRGVALVRSYNPEKRLVDLWDAEYAVFGLLVVVTLEKFIEIGDLNCQGRSPYGLVKFSRGAAERPPKRQTLMKAPRTPEEEEEQEADLSRSRRCHQSRAFIVDSGSS